MRKHAGVLLTSTMTVIGLAVGVSPAHAVSDPVEAIGQVFLLENYGGPPLTIQSQRSCGPIFADPRLGPARSAVNTSTSSAITLYATRSFLGPCAEEVAFLLPGESNSGYIPGIGFPNKLGATGARFYTSRRL